MASTFLAIPLPRQGESFVLRTVHDGKDMTIVVDTGWRAEPAECKQALDAFLRTNLPDLFRIDRLILTHEDADHCQGAAQFIGEWVGGGKHISEVWLPSVWAAASAKPVRSNWVRSRIVKGAFLAAPEIEKALRKLVSEHGSAVDIDIFGEDVYLSEAIRVAARETGSLEGLFERRGEQSQAESISREGLN